MAKKVKNPKIEVIRPKVQKAVEKESKNVSVSAKKDTKVENVYQAYGEAERTIQELTRLYVEAEDSRHYGVSGTMKPTQKQMVIQMQLDKANERAKEILKKLY